MGFFPILKGEKKNTQKTSFVYPKIDTSGMTFDSCKSGKVETESGPTVPDAVNTPAVQTNNALKKQEAEDM